jgi:hypothetical protein
MYFLSFYSILEEIFQMKEPIVKRIWLFYYDGFRSMTLGKTLWLIIAIKLFIMFFVLKLFFFKSELGKYPTEDDKAKHVVTRLTAPAKN